MRFVCIQQFLSRLFFLSFLGFVFAVLPVMFDPQQALAGQLVLAQAEVEPLVSGQRVQVKRLTRSMASVRESLVTSGPSHFQHPETFQKLKKRFDQFTEALNRYPQVEDPDVIAMRNEYQTLRQALNTEYRRAAEQQQKLGDVQARLATLQQNFVDYPIPALPEIPFDKAQAESWVQASSNARTVADHTVQQLADIIELAYLPKNPGTPQNGSPYDKDDVSRLLRFAQETQNKVQTNYASLNNTLQSQMQQLEAEIRTRWQENPDSDKRWLFTADDQEEQAMAVYDRAIGTAQSSLFLEQALSRPTDSAENLIGLAELAKVQFLENKRIAIDTARLPEPASTDPMMLDIARNILATPSYEIGETGPVVLTTDSIVERERKDSEIDIDDAELTLSGDLKLSGTETTWTYKWQEFRFAVPILNKDAGDWHIWWFTAKNYSSGDSNTPLNRWLSGKRTKGVPILPENFPKG